MKRRFLFFSFALGFFLMGQGDAFAHMRDYLLNQNYYTARRGELEVELWNDYNMKDFDNDGTHSSRHQIELEYGLTNRWQWAYYEVFKWDRKDDFERDMFKIETKYRFFESGELPVDVALYAEYKNPNGRADRRSDALEGKLILSKDLGPWNFIANLITEKEINTHGFWKFEYTLGASYLLNPKTRLGVELKESLGDADAFGIRRKDHKLQILPGIYTNLSPNVRLLVGPAFGITRATDDLQIRSIIEVEF